MSAPRTPAERRLEELATAHGARVLAYLTRRTDPPSDAADVFQEVLTTAWRKIPLVTHQEQFLTDRGPMKVWFDRARAMEADPRVLQASNYPMQPWLDVAESDSTRVFAVNWRNYSLSEQNPSVC